MMAGPTVAIQRLGSVAKVPGEVRRRRPAESSAWWSSSRARLILMSVAAAAVVAVAGQTLSRTYAPLAGCDTAAMLFCTWAWVSIPSLDADRAAHATREDPGQAQSDVIVVTAAVASLASIGAVLVRSTGGRGATQDLLAGLGVASVLLSWLTVHTDPVQARRRRLPSSPGRRARPTAPARPASRPRRGRGRCSCSGLAV
jgi:hypothetical protein